jgi:hypothetical protein
MDNEKLKKLVLDKISLQNKIKEQNAIISKLQKENNEYKNEMIKEREEMKKIIVNELNKKFDERIKNELKKVQELFDNKLKEMGQKLEESFKQKLEKIEKNKYSFNNYFEENNFLSKKRLYNSKNNKKNDQNENNINIYNMNNNEKKNSILKDTKKSFKENMINNNISNENKISFDKNNNNIKDIKDISIKNNLDNIINIKTKYSYECTNIKELSISIDLDTKEAMIPISLRNNGKQTWPENNTKLIFDKNSNIFGDEIILNPQKPNEEEEYFMLFKGLEEYPEGDYKAYIHFSVNGYIFDEKIFLQITIKEKSEGI